MAPSAATRRPGHTVGGRATPPCFQEQDRPSAADVLDGGTARAFGYHPLQHRRHLQGHQHAPEEQHETCPTKRRKMPPFRPLERKRRVRRRHLTAPTAIAGSCGLIISLRAPPDESAAGSTGSRPTSSKPPPSEPRSRDVEHRPLPTRSPRHAPTSSPFPARADPKSRSPARAYPKYRPRLPPTRSSGPRLASTASPGPQLEPIRSLGPTRSPAPLLAPTQVPPSTGADSDFAARLEPTSPGDSAGRHTRRSSTPAGAGTAPRH